MSEQLVVWSVEKQGWIPLPNHFPYNEAPPQYFLGNVVQINDSGNAFPEFEKMINSIPQL